MNCLKQDMYSALPLSEDCGIVEWLDDEAVVPLEKVLRGVNNNNTTTTTTNSETNNTTTNNNTAAVSSIAPTTSYSVLRQYLLSASRDPLDTRRQVFCRSVQFSILLCHILGVSDRHLSNVMINTRTLAIVDIDFGFMFGSRTWTEQVDLLGKKLLLSMYYSASGPTHKIHGITTARFDPILAEAVTEMRYQATQAQRELRKRRQELQQQLQIDQHQQQQQQTTTAKKSNVTITRVSNNTNDASPDNNNSNATTQDAAALVALTPEELQRQEYERNMRQREAALDDFINETAKILFVKIRPHMDIISLLFTKSSRYLDDLGGQQNNNNNRNNSSSLGTKGNNNNMIGSGGSNNNNNGTSGSYRNTNDETIAEHFFHCFALTKTDADAQDSFRRELKEVRSRYFQDLMHTANQLGALGLLNAGLESFKSFFGGQTGAGAA